MSVLSKIQALITAANAKTGESDTTLTDAVQTLVDGYGQGGGIENGLEIVDYYDSGEIKEVNWYGDTAYKGLQYAWYSAKPVAISVMDATVIEPYFFSSTYGYPVISSLEKITDIKTSAFCFTTNAVNDLSSTILSLPNLATSSVRAESRFRSNSLYYYGGFYFPKNQRIGKYDFYQHRVPNATWQIGSIGYPVLESNLQPFGGTSGSGTITIYTTGALLDTIKAEVQNGAGANYTFVYKAAEATEYGGVSYAAGDTMLTVGGS